MPFFEVTDFYETCKRVNEFISRGPVTENSEERSEIGIRTTAGSGCYHAFI
jgi:hypothetical protein